METKEKLFILGEYADPATEYLKDNEWTFTEKIDGTNIRIYWDGETVAFGGRTDAAQLPAHLVNVLKEKITPELMRTIFPDMQANDGIVTLYGEGCGYKIQKGGMGYVNNEKRADFILFDVRIGDWWLKREDAEGIAESLGLRIAPVVLKGTIEDAIEMVSAGMKSTYGDFIAEGVVGKPSVELADRAGRRIITKIKHRDFKHLKEAENES